MCGNKHARVLLPLHALARARARCTRTGRFCAETAKVAVAGGAGGASLMCFARGPAESGRRAAAGVNVAAGCWCGAAAPVASRVSSALEAGVGVLGSAELVEMSSRSSRVRIKRALPSFTSSPGSRENKR